MKLKKFLVLFFIPFITGNAEAQDYSRSVGFRAGLSQGITYKQFLNRQDAAEGILAIRWGGFNITGLYERHHAAFDVDGLYFYYGAGGHIGFWDGYNHPWFYDNNSHTVVGVDGILGLEYVFGEIPFNVSLDWKPGINLIGTTKFWGDELALSFRFMF